MDSPDAPVRVVVCKITGEEVEFQVQPAETVKAVKALVAEQWGWVVASQKMSVGTTVLEDLPHVSEYCADLTPGEALRILCVCGIPYDGDIHKASLAGDRESVKMLMQRRDKDKAMEIPASIAVCYRRDLRYMRSWPRMREALIQEGYNPEQVDAAVQELPENSSYNDVSKHLVDLKLGSPAMHATEAMRATEAAHAAEASHGTEATNVTTVAAPCGYRVFTDVDDTMARHLTAWRHFRSRMLPGPEV